ncbi:MAG TPA: 5-deoxy-glucuronate isomerase [Opitutaceae bacterium]|nr:5-deoxy-glucuronate isomerase [Opitutaceae bacterium]
MTPPPNAVLRGPRAGFPAGQTLLWREDDPAFPRGAGLDFAILRLPAGAELRECSPKESAWILLGGEADVGFGRRRVRVRRQDVFVDNPTTLHVGPRTRVTIRSLKAGTEFAVARTANTRKFSPRLFGPDDMKPEYRGAGLVQNACLRNVRLIFDRKGRPRSNLVIGEVVNYPGRWSSYPPHHHDQPEIYHYRFTRGGGYGHAELGEDVVKVRARDTILIPPGLDHAQVSAPGYGMYYLWVIRHLPGNPYTGFTFAEEHAWTLDPARQGWRPSDGPGSAP